MKTATHEEREEILRSAQEDSHAQGRRQRQILQLRRLAYPLVSRHLIT